MKNQSWANAVDPYYNQEKRFLFHLIPDGPNVILDCGCGAGAMGKKLMEIKKASEVIGVEIFEPPAKKAMEFYQRVHVGNIEEMPLEYDGYFDVVICGDVLEHLVEPKKMVQRLHGMLKPGGLIVCCLPNVRHARVLKNLLIRGDWHYESEGIMDQTHLRFFTTKSFHRLLSEASFVVEEQGMQIYDARHRLINRLTFGFFQEFLGFQFYFLARKR
jgi:2-polyprenyl-3-methyl-5-hydroxy-6-metoxy-1,4-benzoquinol methylase